MRLVKVMAKSVAVFFSAIDFVVLFVRMLVLPSASWPLSPGKRGGLWFSLLAMALSLLPLVFGLLETWRRGLLEALGLLVTRP